MDTPGNIDTVVFRVATDADVSGMAAYRLRDPEASPADPRMAAYFKGQHYPQGALMPRTGFVALADGVMVGYIAGHLTTRHGCAGEVQYLFVAPEFRRRGIATGLLRLMARCFKENAAARVCVDTGSPAARRFYRSLGASPLSRHRYYWYVWEDIGFLFS
jgi:ribosomal protein S18 acetylase RimI-like enzyme